MATKDKKKPRKTENPSQSARVDSIPPHFGAAFLSWFRSRTERTWVSDLPQRRWLPGLSEDEIISVEQTWNVHFPPDYRLFLSQLHAVGEVVPGRGRKHLLPLHKSKVVYNWLLDDTDVRRAFAWPFEGLAFDLEHNDFWLPSWGERPATLGTQRERLRQAVAAAPTLIPITGHRYLLAEPCQAGNLVLSVYQRDIIIYGGDLRRYLLAEFAEVLGIARTSVLQQAIEAPPLLADVPFWGEVAY